MVQLVRKVGVLATEVLRRLTVDTKQRADPPSPGIKNTVRNQCVQSAIIKEVELNKCCFLSFPPDFGHFCGFCADRTRTRLVHFSLFNPESAANVL